MSARHAALVAAMREMSPANAWEDVDEADAAVVFLRTALGRIYAHGFRDREALDASEVVETATWDGCQVVMLLDMEQAKIVVPVLRWEPRACRWPGGCDQIAPPDGRPFKDGRLCAEHGAFSRDLEAEARG